MAIRRYLLALAAIAIFGTVQTAAAADLGPLLKTLQAVGPKGEGNPAASKAWQALAQADAAALPEMLAAMDDAGPLADNWIRTAVDAVAERQLARGGPLPADALRRFVLDTSHNPRARRVAFEWLIEVEPTARHELLAGMLDDASLELRRDAVAQLIGDAVQAAELGSEKDASPMYRRALAAARDPDQIKLLADRLGKLGEKVDLARQYGYVLRWKLLGPFDNAGQQGFDVAYPPEEKVDFAASCQGKHGPVAWIDYTSTNAQGLVDLNKGIGEEKAVVAYAATEFVADKQQEIEIRYTTANASKLWLDGRLLAAYNVYHSGSPMDQYVRRAVLEPGRHLIVLKVCQNEQTQDWARVWNFRLRVCDPLGGAVLSADRGDETTDSERGDSE